MGVPLAEITSNTQFWIEEMRSYFLGFQTSDELETRLRRMGSTEPADVEERLRVFEDACGDLIWPLDPPITRVLEPNRRRYFINQAQLTQEARKQNHLTHFRSKQIPDNSLIVSKGKSIYDVRCLEEVGFVRCDNVLVSRTIQPFARYTSNAQLISQQPVTEATVLLIPDQTEEEFFANFPFTRTLNGDGIVLTGEFTPVNLSASFIKKHDLPVTQALAHVGIKSKLEVTKSRSKKQVDRGYLRGVIQ